MNKMLSLILLTIWSEGPRTGRGVDGQIRIRNERHIRRRKLVELGENDGIYDFT
jgi:hypothetical protein